MAPMAGDIEGTPNCPTCLHALEITGSDARPYWSCPSCSHIALTS